MERKLTAILCADVFGYSRLMGENEEATLRTLSSHRKTIDGLIAQHHGRFVNSAGDSVLADFASVVNAVQCALDVQTALKAENANLPVERRMEFRIGVNLGDVMVEGEQIYGDGVNVAARLESLAEPGGLCISATVRDHIKNKLTLSYADLGEQHVKNIAEAVRVFRVLLNGTVPATQVIQRIPRSRYWRGSILSLTGLAIIIGTIVLVQNLTLKSPHTHASIPPQEKPALPLPSIPSIAVLPFANLSGDQQQEYFSDGISDQLINDISRLPGLFVIARNSSFAFKGKATKEQEIGRELGVRYVLEGSVRKASEQVRIGVELVDAATGTEMWTQRFDRPLKDIFAVQDEIVGKVVTTLGLIFRLDEMNAPHGASFRPTDNLEAYDDFLRGVQFRSRLTKEDNANARQWYEKAIGVDPQFGEAYAALGWTYWANAWNQWSTNPQADVVRSIQMVNRALALDDSNADALALLSYADWLQNRFDQAVEDAKRAVAVNPNSAKAYMALADALLNAAEQPEEALRATEKATRLDPAAADFFTYSAGAAYYEMGRYEKAVSLLKRNIAAYPNDLTAHIFLLGSYAELGRDQDARAEAGEILRISPRWTSSSHKGKSEALNKQFDREFRTAGLK